MNTPKSLSFQEFFSRYCNVFGIQNSLPKFLNYDPTPANLLLHNFRLPQDYTDTHQFVTNLETINFQNKLYQYQNIIEFDRSLAKKFTTSVPTDLDSVKYNQYKNQLKLEKFKQQNNDLKNFDQQKSLTYLGLYHSSKSNQWFDTQTSFFGLSYKERLGHNLISGNSDAGKNSVLINMIGQDLVHGSGVALVSSNSELFEILLSTMPVFRQEDVLYFKPGDADFSFGVDLFDGKDIDSTMETVLNIFENIWQGEISDKITYYLEPVLHLLLMNQDKSSFSDYVNIIYNPEFRTALLDNVTDVKINYFWKNVTKTQMMEIQSTLIKLETINRNRVIRELIENTVKQIKISSIIAQKKILLVDLSNLAEDNVSSRFIGNMVIKKIAQLSGEVKIEDIFPVYVDDFWNYSGQDMFAKAGYLRKNKVAMTYTQQGTFNKNEDPKLGIVSFGSFVNKLTFNTSDPYSTYNNHNQDMEIDPILKKLPSDTCMFEGTLQNQPTNPFLIEVVQESFLAIQTQPAQINNPNNFEYIKPKLVINQVKPKTEKPKSKLQEKKMDVKSPLAKGLSQSGEVSKVEKPNSSHAKKELEAKKNELDNKIRLDADGNPRKTAMNSARRKKINDQIKEIDLQLQNL
jgi:hypothetical protein